MPNVQLRGVVVVVLGVMLLVATLASFGPSSAAQAQDLPPRPTARPTAQPTTSPSTSPTARPARRHETDRPPQGRISGTVIDAGSDHPLGGVGVRVGTVIVLSDADGNYTRAELGAGVYEVALAPGQGALVGGPLQVQLANGAHVIQHLSVRRPSPRASIP